MRRMSLLVVVAASVFALSAGTLAGRTDTVEGAKPALVHGGVTLTEDGAGHCVGTVTWSGLKGGKPLKVHARLASFNGTTWQTVLQDGANVVHEVKGGAGQLVVDYGVDVNATSTSLRLFVSYEERDGDIIGGAIYEADGTCD